MSAARPKTRLHIVGRRPVERLQLKDLRASLSHKLKNQLYGAGGFRFNGLTLYWRAIRAAQAREWVALVADDVRMQIALDGDAIGLDAPQVDWRSCSGETRLLAWTACHEPLIQLLGAVFQRDWIPETLADRDVARQPGRLCAGFSVHRADGARVVFGLAHFSGSAVAGVVAAGGGCARAEQFLDGVRAQLPCIIDEVGASPEALSMLTPGCIVRLDNRSLATARPRVVAPAGAVNLIIELAGARATVIGIAGSTTYPDGGSPMTLDHPTTDKPSAETQRDAGARAAIDARSLPVRLAFSAGRLSVAISELSNVAPGYVFELGRPLDDQLITVFANDTPVALGELVAIGDLVGVRITRLLGRT